jgi:hypothetical protein
LRFIALLSSGDTKNVLPPIQSLPRIKLKEFFDQIWPIKATRRHVHYKDAALIAAKLSGRFEKTPCLTL